MNKDLYTSDYINTGTLHQSHSQVEQTLVKMMTYFLLFCLLLSHTEAKTISHPPAAPSPHHFPPLESSPKDSLLPAPSPPLPYDHFWLVHTWPNGFCSYSSLVHCPQRHNLPLELTIHGWWPVDRKDSTLHNNNWRQVGPIDNLVITHSHVICCF